MFLVSSVVVSSCRVAVVQPRKRNREDIQLIRRYILTFLLKMTQTFRPWSKERMVMAYRLAILENEVFDNKVVVSDDLVDERTW